MEHKEGAKEAGAVVKQQGWMHGLVPFTKVACMKAALRAWMGTGLT